MRARKREKPADSDTTKADNALAVEYHKAENAEQEDIAIITGLHEPETTPTPSQNTNSLPLPQRKSKFRARKFSTQALHPLRALTHMKTLHQYEVNPATEYVERQNTLKARRQLFPTAPPMNGKHRRVRRTPPPTSYGRRQRHLKSKPIIFPMS